MNRATARNSSLTQAEEVKLEGPALDELKRLRRITGIYRLARDLGTCRETLNEALEGGYMLRKTRDKLAERLIGKGAER